MTVGIGGGLSHEVKAAHRRGELELKSGIETKLIQTEKLSVTPVFPLHCIQTAAEEGLTTTVGWWKMGPLVSFLEVDGLETH